MRHEGGFALCWRANVKRWRKLVAEKGEDPSSIAVDGQPDDGTTAPGSGAQQKKKTN